MNEIIESLSSNKQRKKYLDKHLLIFHITYCIKRASNITVSLKQYGVLNIFK